MFHEKLLNFINRYKLNLIILFFSLIYFFVTAFDSYIDVINPDSINWHNRSYFFMKSLYTGELSNTYQVYHPGISLMWVMGLSTYSDGNYYSKATFLQKDYQVKISIYFILTLCFSYSLFLLKDFLRPSSLILFSVIYTFEPFILGVRRLVHLEALMTAFLLLSFLLLLKNSFHKQSKLNLILGSMFFVLAFYTKSSAILVLPILFLIFLFGSGGLKQKILGVSLTIFSITLFLYLFFPALWKNPIVKSQIFFTKIYEGAALIGYEGRREVGTSGTGDNQILKKSHTKVSNFYSDSLLFTSSPSLILILLLCIPVLVFFLIKKFKNSSLKSSIKEMFKSKSFYLALFSVLTFVLYFTAYSMSTKSYERYSYVLFPFIILFIASIYNLINLNLILSVGFLYFLLVLIELINIHPYYYSYGNSYLGGSYSRYEKLNSPPFGVGVYQLNKILTEYIKNNDPEVYPVIAGSKTLKAIFSSGRNERYPLCDVDYFIQFYDDKTPHEVCIGRAYVELFSIKVGNIDYWKVYKFNKKSSKSKKLNEIDIKKQHEVKPEVESTEE